MKSYSILSICCIASFLVPHQEEVLGQTLYPMYGGEPIPYDNHDDDLGLLLTVLLLAARNSNGANCNCCDCCNCGSGKKSMPIPYPIPIPTNNPVINNRRSEYTDNGTNKKKYSNSTLKQSPMPLVNYTLTYVPVPVGSDSVEYYDS
ncbi:unnamed protein product [Euphydryas editha]|uniref:Uncharacterized protein n=1 Tax=Euphydryas editha TaxID=104508 RepID=A0AAU9UP51_EUPED|nr:unnamed protein product [Euphydryas editha]